MQLFTILIGSLLINNIVLNRFLGICPFLGVSKKKEAALGMGIAVTFVIVISNIITHTLYNVLLVPLKIEYMRLIVFILVIASLVQFVEMFIKKSSPGLYKSLGVYLPLITTNCAVLGVTIDTITRGYNLVEAIVYALGVSLGFSMIMYLFSSIREQLEIKNTPNSFKGLPIALITAGLMAVAFTAFAGLV